MADDTNPAPAAEPTTAAPAASPEKKRKPRTPKAVAVPPAAAVTTPTGRGRRKSINAPTESEAASAPKARGGRGKANVGGTKADGRKRAPARSAEAASFSSAADEMTDLLKLEEENKLLRKQLADKLRAENVDLRKKLGMK